MYYYVIVMLQHTQRGIIFINYNIEYELSPC